MKRIISLTFILVSSLFLAQNTKYTDAEIKKKLDSIKAEGNLLFSLENSSWHSTDLARENKKINGNFGGYLTYKNNDTVKTVILHKDRNLVIAEYSFTNNSKKPIKENLYQRNLNSNENNLKNIRSKVIAQLSDPKYEVGVPNGFNLNIITIPFEESYKNYVITGSSEANVIPFGNDYLFITDKEGNIISNKKFHSRLIPTMTSMPEGGIVTMSTHSHLKTNPFISATDICTFKLYAPFTKLEEFSVYSPSLDGYMIYNYKKDSLIKSKDFK
ncbi:hypothetical protein [Chryseobacterium indoltheticum]|uniref:Uncharacterized protein n=1 Tax=Chryseobacterium indoltheticum TaxID=254 RepID=A0A381F9W5_9FLAO|nr:hypothetical protein [Chryseobacterium indoltheticum]SIR02996.1 hypothetical protein SAMN05421682_111106 [Chryseobacterium indoltheticum]SUX43258.1 Uncharacterised protein [Chryseobacterium indoltheticum]